MEKRGLLSLQSDLVNYTLSKAYSQNFRAAHYLELFGKFNSTSTRQYGFWLGFLRVRFWFCFSLSFRVGVWEYFVTGHLPVKINTVWRKHNICWKCSCKQIWMCGTKGKYESAIIILLNWPSTWYFTPFPLSKLTTIFPLNVVALSTCNNNIPSLITNIRKVESWFDI